MGEYEGRHIGLSNSNQQSMLASLGFSDLDALIDAAMPESVRSAEPMDLPKPATETELLAELNELAHANEVRTPLMGMGYTRCITPAVIRRNVLQNPAWYTAYTPYQPEISQGRLEALLVFQTLVSDLTGLVTANASLLDEATAVAEAMALSHRQYRGKAQRYLIDADTHPQTIAVVCTRAEPIGIQVDVRDLRNEFDASDYFGVAISYPGSSGRVSDPSEIASNVKSAGGLVTAVTDLLALTLLIPPGQWGADIAVGSAQRFGVPLGFGGPHAGFMSVRAGLERALPGRLVGVSTDSSGQPAYRLALQTREQHIRREKATSNICTSQVLLANISAFYAAYHGPEGLTAIAQRVHLHAVDLAARLGSLGIEPESTTFFDTITFTAPDMAMQIVKTLAATGIDVRPIDADRFAVTVDEVTTEPLVDSVVAGVSAAINAGDSAQTPTDASDFALPPSLMRTSEFLTHPWFSSYRSETQMMRWLRRLADMDLALDRSMIPLGSCTMKLNAAAAMEPISWPGFADIHPFAPAESTAGYRTLIDRLEQWLCEITGYDAVSVQPNAGSQGEFAGLLAIRQYLRSRGEGERDVCLIPASAHGTNAASAAMAGMKVVVIANDDSGGIDMSDLRMKIAEHSGDLAAIMVTYPSTSGVYEDTMVEVSQLVHEAGGQVYVDGANLNALVGLAQPGKFGADVSHLNLHKTFCIPHGGGGPGVGPIGVKAHLAPFLPGHPIWDFSSEDTNSEAVSAAPYGSAGILPIPYAYIRMMGAEGLKHATMSAVLSANYVANKLGSYYPVLFTGHNGLVAHECILDLRDITKRTGVSVDDVAKRLIDYGFHAPTMSFPVSGTLMVEPTESEDIGEIDRFCDAMISIYAEIERVAAGEWPVESSPLRNAPHTASSIAADWPWAYDRELAVYPVKHMARTKYWPPVGRIDGAYGDRNLMCSCPPIESFQ